MEEIKPYNISLVLAVRAKFFRMYECTCFGVSANQVNSYFALNLKVAYAHGILQVGLLYCVSSLNTALE